MKLPDINRKEFLEAISFGVKDAILTMTETGDGFTGPICLEPFLYAIQKGVSEAFNSQIATLSENVCVKMESLIEELDTLSTEIFELRTKLNNKGD